MLVSKEAIANCEITKSFPKSCRVEDLSEETIKAIANSKMDSRHDHLNALLDDE